MCETKDLLVDVRDYDHSKWSSENVSGNLTLNFFGVTEMTIGILTLLDKIEESADKFEHIYFQNIHEDVHLKVEKIKSRHDNIKIII